MDDTVFIPFEGDWAKEGNCLVTEAGDTSFIRKPDELTARRWARTCSRCPVIEECFAWANKYNATGVFVAGEWRD